MPGILDIRERPRLRRPILIAGFGGWGNAGSASTGAVEYLLGEPKPEPCALADPDLCFDFTVARPQTLRGGPDGWRLVLPRFAVYALPRPGAPRDLLLVMGPEPNFRWTALAGAIASFAADCGVELGFPLGAFIGAVSHRRPLLTRRTLHAPLGVALAEIGVAETPYEGPTAFQSALLHALHEQGIPAASIWVGTAPYVQGAQPRAMLALLDAVDRVAGAGLDLNRLRAQSADWSRHLDRILASNPQLAAQLGQIIDMEERDEPEEHPTTPEGSVPAGELPTGRELVEELERFLRRSQRPPEESEG